MSTIILHAGMSKTGSSSIQDWLGRQSEWLRDQDIELLEVHRVGSGENVEVAPCRQGASRTVIDRPRLGREAGQQLFDQLDGYARQHKTVILTSEDFTSWFRKTDSEFLELMDRLATRHHLRVAYYIRPQHTSLEAAWRQWGFRSGVQPRAYVEGRLHILYYLQTMDHVNSVAPHVSFEVRPFRNDLLVGGDVVEDFAKVFLGLSAAARRNQPKWSNRGFPLELVNILRHAPPNSLWSTAHENVKLNRLRRVVDDWGVEEGAKAKESRRLLQAFCHNEFEGENRVLIRRLGWKTEWFVPPVIPELPTHDLADLDRLWNSDASPEERQLLFRLIEEVVTHAAPNRPDSVTVQPARPGHASAGPKSHSTRRGARWLSRFRHGQA